MKSVFFNPEVLETEKQIISSLAIPSILLMENAGKNSADFIKSLLYQFEFDKIYILAGKGNNAGDGFVIARHLLDCGISIELVLLYPEDSLKGDALINYEIIKKYNNHEGFNISSAVDSLSFKNLINCRFPLFIDSVFGIGFKGKLEPRISEIFSFINSIEKKVIAAIDTVSGLSSYNTTGEELKCDYTLSMGVRKYNSIFAGGKELSGENHNMNIGIPAAEFDILNTRKIFEVESADFKTVFHKRNINSHKYNNGKVFVLAGSKGFTGAAYLASLSALKCGSGAVILGIPESLNDILEKKTTEVITLPLEETDDCTFAGSALDKINEKIKWSDVTLIGPGIGRNQETLSLIREIVSQNDSKFVIDADGLFAFGGYNEFLKKSKNKVIITPHYGEFANLTGLSSDDIKNNFHDISRSFADKYNCVVVLKNAPTITTDGETFLINSSGRQNLATVGSGDVLSGITASLYSQNDNALMSAAGATFLHGECGDILFDETGDSSTIASELINLIPVVKKSIQD